MCYHLMNALCKIRSSFRCLFLGRIGSSFRFATFLASRLHEIYSPRAKVTKMFLQCINVLNACMWLFHFSETACINHQLRLHEKTREWQVATGSFLSLTSTMRTVKRYILELLLELLQDLFNGSHDSCGRSAMQSNLKTRFRWEECNVK